MYKIFVKYEICDEILIDGVIYKAWQYTAAALTARGVVGLWVTAYFHGTTFNRERMPWGE